MGVQVGMNRTSTRKDLSKVPAFIRDEYLELLDYYTQELDEYIRIKRT